MGDNELQIFSDRLKDLRLSLNMTQVEFVEKIGITTSALSAYEKNLKNPSIGVVKRISEQYNVSIDWLCGLSNQKNYKNTIICKADLYKKFFEIEKYGGLQFDNSTAIVSSNNDGFPSTSLEVPISAIYFDDLDIVTFMNEWRKMKHLHDVGTIDDDVYNLWKEKVLLNKENQKPDFLPF